MFGIFRRGHSVINQSSVNTVILEVVGRKPWQMWNVNANSIATAILALAESVVDQQETGYRFTMSLRAIPAVDTPFNENEWLAMLELSGLVTVVEAINLPQTDGNIQSEYIFEKTEPYSATA